VSAEEVAVLVDPGACDAETERQLAGAEQPLGLLCLLLLVVVCE
jgi:hypothetical protein